MPTHLMNFGLFLAYLSQILFTLTFVSTFFYGVCLGICKWRISGIKMDEDGSSALLISTCSVIAILSIYTGMPVIEDGSWIWRTFGGITHSAINAFALVSAVVICTRLTYIYHDHLSSDLLARWNGFKGWAWALLWVMLAFALAAACFGGFIDHHVVRSYALTHKALIVYFVVVFISSIIELIVIDVTWVKVPMGLVIGLSAVGFVGSIPFNGTHEDLKIHWDGAKVVQNTVQLVENSDKFLEQVKTEGVSGVLTSARTISAADTSTGAGEAAVVANTSQSWFGKVWSGFCNRLWNRAPTWFQRIYEAFGKASEYLGADEYSDVNKVILGAAAFIAVTISAITFALSFTHILTSSAPLIASLYFAAYFTIMWNGYQVKSVPQIKLPTATGDSMPVLKGQTTAELEQQQAGSFVSAASSIGRAGSLQPGASFQSATSERGLVARQSSTDSAGSQWQDETAPLQGQPALAAQVAQQAAIRQGLAPAARPALTRQNTPRPNI